jgi:signal peptidase II
MKTRISPLHKSILIIFLVLFADQALKIWIKTNFFLGEHIRVADWFFIYFIENNGMAFGVELFSKIFLTLFRIVAVIFIGYFIYSSIKKEKYPFGFISCSVIHFCRSFG